MSSTSEQSFGARLQKGYNINTFTSNFPGYAPPREEETPASMKTFLDNLAGINSSVTKAKEGYTMAVKHRQDLFKEDESSMMKLLALIIGALDAQYGKGSKESTMIASIISRIRASHIEKAPTNPDDPDAKEKISRSARSFGSLTQNFNDIVTNLGEFEDYKPANPLIAITALKALSVSLLESNNNVAATFQARSDLIATRLSMYTELKDRTDRIKGNTKSQYGNNSKEHKLIKGIKI